MTTAYDDSVINSRGEVVTFNEWMALADKYMSENGFDPQGYDEADDPVAWEQANIDAMRRADETLGVDSGVDTMEAL